MPLGHIATCQHLRSNYSLFIWKARRKHHLLQPYWRHKFKIILYSRSMSKCQGREQLSYSSPQGKTKLIIFSNPHSPSPSTHDDLPSYPRPATFSFLLPLFPILTQVPPGTLDQLLAPHLLSPPGGSRPPLPSRPIWPRYAPWTLPPRAVNDVSQHLETFKQYQGYRQIARWWWQVAKAGCVRTRPGSLGQQRFLWRFHQVGRNSI